MAIAYYPLIVHRTREGFGAFFPDFPGCASAGMSVMDAVRNAGDALTGHLDIHIAAGFYEELPAPSLLDEVGSGPVGEEVARLLVPIEVSEDERDRARSARRPDDES